MPKCIFGNCDNGTRKKSSQKNHGVHLHRFPKDILSCEMWLQQIKYGQCIDTKSINLKTGNFIF